MGFLNLFQNGPAKGPTPLPAGSFTVDRSGEIIASTVSSQFSAQRLSQISALVLRAFQTARAADLSLSEIAVSLGAMNIKAREMRGGAIIFLSPRASTRKSSTIQKA